MIRKNDHSEISVYTGELTADNVIKNVSKIKMSFPSLPAEFYDVFSDRIKDNGFSNERLNDAVNHVVDNCIYPVPTIAQFIAFDQRIKLYTYADMVKKNDEYSRVFEFYRPIKIQGLDKPMYASIDDIAKYKLESFRK